jgi:tetratricopeptide (TPR) repeat protein
MIKPKKIARKSNAKNAATGYKKRWYYVALVLAALLAFGGALGCLFTNWDDPAYVTANTSITSWSALHLKDVLFKFTAGNYHPLTMFSFSLDYFFYQKNPVGYHFSNLLLHCINTCFVFTFIYKLCSRKEVAFLVALFFCIQPMHAESVVWISERKDLLYTFFLLIGMIFYLKLEVGAARYSIRKYGWVVFFFILSLLSKGQAVIFPVLLLVIDYYRGEIKMPSRWIEKVPLFLLSALFGLIAIRAQQSTDAMQNGQHLDILQRILAAGYGIFTYSWKAVFPVCLSCLHPYPPSISSDGYFYVVTTVVIIIATTVFIKRKNNRALFTGLLFYLIALLPVLQLLPVGVAITAERYTYVAYIGFFFAVFSLVPAENFKKAHTLVPISIMIIFFLVASRNRCDVWKNNFALWTDVIHQYPQCAIPYCNRGFAYSENKQFELAEKDFLKAIEYDSLYCTAFNNLGLINFNRQRYDAAIFYFDKAIRSNAKFGEAYNNRGVAFIQMGRTKEAFNDFNQSVNFDPLFANGWRNRGNFFVQNGDTARGLMDLKKASALYLDLGQKNEHALMKERIQYISGK